jgi:hypothetical protein
MTLGTFARIASPTIAGYLIGVTPFIIHASDLRSALINLVVVQYY